LPHWAPTADRRAIAVALFVGFGAALAGLIAAPGRDGLFGGALAFLMLAIAAIDARSFIIPDELTAAAFLLALIHAETGAFDGLWDSGGEAVALATLRGFLVAMVFYLLRETYRRLRGRQGLGLGDVKLAGVAGAWLDWTMIPIAIELAALSALAYYLVRYVILKGRPLRPNGRLPFGLFFAPAIWVGWLLGTTLFSGG
jgi:leader peptidase (prepilin peptidase)/N-methyltransferase